MFLRLTPYCSYFLLLITCFLLFRLITSFWSYCLLLIFRTSYVLLFLLRTSVMSYVLCRLLITSLFLLLNVLTSYLFLFLLNTSYVSYFGGVLFLLHIPYISYVVVLTCRIDYFLIHVFLTSDCLFFLCLRLMILTSFTSCFSVFLLLTDYCLPLTPYCSCFLLLTWLTC